jgi:hypothetical protein
LLKHKSQAKAHGNGYSYVDLRTEGSGKHRLYFKDSWVHSSNDASLVFCSGDSSPPSGACSLLGVSVNGCFEVTPLQTHTLTQTEQLLGAINLNYPGK